MNRIIKLMIALSSLLLTQPQEAAAQGNAKEDKTLVGLLDQLSEADGYTYQVNIFSEVVGKAKEKELMKMTNYQSRQSFIVYSKTDDILLFLCENGQFRVNHKEKEVFYAAFPKDAAALNEKKEALIKQFSSYAVGSYFLDAATIAGKTAGKLNITYKLRYPETSMIRDMLIDYNVKTSFFNRLQYTVEKPISGSASLETGKPAVMRQKVVMDGYVQAVPSQVRQLLESTRNLRSYLEQTYKGYQIQTINL
jgi:hypothetical protein